MHPIDIPIRLDAARVLPITLVSSCARESSGFLQTFIISIQIYAKFIILNMKFIVFY